MEKVSLNGKLGEEGQHGADPSLAGYRGRTPAVMKICKGRRDLLAHLRPPEAGIIYHDAGYMKPGLVLLLEHCIRDIRHILACKALASDIDLAMVQLKEIHEALPEPKGLHSSGLRRRRIGRALGKPSAYRLVNPDDVGQVAPAPRVAYGSMRALSPKNRSLLAEEAVER